MKGYDSRQRKRRTSYQNRQRKQARERSKDAKRRYDFNKGNYKTKGYSVGYGRRGQKINYFRVIIFVPLVILFLIGVIALFKFIGDSIEAGKDPMGENFSSSVSANAVVAEESLAKPLSAYAADVKSVSLSAISVPAVERKTKVVALTFDDGPSTENSNKVLDVLEQYKVQATFFVCGERITEASKAILQRELALGCEIGNHSWNHPDLSKMTMKKVNKQINRTSKAVKDATGYDIKIVRPPYGAISKAMRSKLKYPMIFWSVDSLDWKSMNAKKILKEVKKQVYDGGIILMHDIHAPTAESLKTVIPWLLNHDYDIVTVSELMKRKGIKMKNGKVYMSGN